MDRFVRASLLGCIFLSGATGLVYEVAWTRSLTLVFGTTSFAVSTILAAFMAGLGAGALLLGKLVDRRGHAVRMYGLLELGIAGSALALPFLLRGLDPLYRAIWERYHPSFLALSVLRFAICFPLLAIPTMLMGGTLPVLLRCFCAGERARGQRAGLLYGLNTLGAVLGTGAAGFVLLPSLGLRATTNRAASFTAGIGILAMALSRYGAEAPSDEGARVNLRDVTRLPLEETSSAQDRGILGVSALSGFVALLAEVSWTRALTLVLGSSTYALTTMLVTFLVGLGIGSLLMARRLARTRDLLWVLALLQGGIGIASLAGAYVFAELPLLYLHLFRAVSGSPAPLVAGQFVLAALVMLAPTMLMGAVFPVVVQLLAGTGGGAGDQVGRVYAANTTGAVLGSSLGGFVLIPRLGVASTLTLAVALSVAGAAGVLIASGRHWRGASVTAALLLSVPLLAPRWEALAMSSGVYKEAPLYLSLYSQPRDVFTRLLPQFRLLYYREGSTATVAVTERPSLEEHRHVALAIDGKVDASTAGDMPTQVLSGHLPLLFHPRPEKVLVIGLASGVTLGAVTRHPVREITAVEIEPAVVEASRFFAPFNHRPLDDPRVRLVVDDARNFLLLGRSRYDVIISEPSNPWMSGPAKLFTREFFQLGRQRLDPGGLFIQWLQLYGMTQDSLRSLVRTFQSVFPYLLVFQPSGGDLLLVGSAGPVRVQVPRIRERMRAGAVATDLERVGVRDVFDLLTRFRLGDAEARAWVGAGPLNTDDNALIEFSAPWQIHLETTAENAEVLGRAGRGVAAYLDGDWPSVRDHARFLLALATRALAARDWRQAETTAREGLALAATADGLWVLGEALAGQGQSEEASRLWRIAVTLEPGHRASRLSLALDDDAKGGALETERHLTSVLARFPDDAVAQFLLGVNRYQAGHYRDSLTLLAGAARARAEGSGADGWLRVHFSEHDLGVEPLAQYYIHLAYGKLRNQRAEERAWVRFLDGLDRWRRALERRAPDGSRFSVIERIRVRSEHGIHLPEEAHLSQVLAQTVLEPLAHYYEGVTASLLGYPEAARTELETMLTRLGPAAPRSRAHYYLGLAYWKLGHFSEARHHLEGFLENLDDRDRQSLAAADATRTLSSIYAAHGQRERAAELERRAAAILGAIEGR